jgi:hypothetical protein
MPRASTPILPCHGFSDGKRFLAGAMGEKKFFVASAKTVHRTRDEVGSHSRLIQEHDGGFAEISVACARNRAKWDTHAFKRSKISSRTRSFFDRESEGYGMWGSTILAIEQ